MCECMSGGGCDKPSQFMLTMHMRFTPQGGEAERLTPLLPWSVLTLRPKCDTSSLRWECMSSVQRKTPGANEDVSALKHNSEVCEVHVRKPVLLISGSDRDAI